MGESSAAYLLWWVRYPHSWRVEVLGRSLRIRWQWAQKIDEERLWAGLPVQAPCNAQALFKVAVQTMVGNSASTKLWSRPLAPWQGNSWICSQHDSDHSKRAVKQRMEAQVLHNIRWVSDIKGAPTVEVLVEYLISWSNPPSTTKVELNSWQSHINIHMGQIQTGSDVFRFS